MRGAVLDSGWDMVALPVLWNAPWVLYGCCGDSHVTERLFFTERCGPADQRMKDSCYYGVRRGFHPGVYRSWVDCKAQVHRFPSACFKKFASEADAWVFVEGVEASAAASSKNVPDMSTFPNRRPKPQEYIPFGQKRRCSDMEVETQGKRHKWAEPTSPQNADSFTYMGDAVVVYADGSCWADGRSYARAGIGVYWGRNHPLNVAERLEGEQTSQRAEIQAVCRALELAQENHIQKLALYTDSKFTIDGVTKWVKHWKVNGWRLVSGGAITNKDDFMKLDRLTTRLDVVWVDVRSHAGHRGNEEADRLAREGAAKPIHIRWVV
ncbi:ribonuclease H1-like [Sphaeramia orbicularis]|uniref:ribonuclease H1-like n=1 Tax=Sphaeramia orbicularis TaxID=375764 RepID=UPI00117C34DF|nr:ribonuclease H1-like [Sphaeramia orbicularis]